MKKSRLKFLEDAWRIAASDKSTPRQALHAKSKQLCNLTDEMNLRKKAITYCSEQAKYEKNIQIKRGLERKVQKWKQFPVHLHELYLSFRTVIVFVLLSS